MATVKVRFYSILRQRTGSTEMIVNASTINDVLIIIENTLGGSIRSLINQCHIYINSDNVAFLKGTKTKLKDNDTIHILPPAGGG